MASAEVDGEWVEEEDEVQHHVFLLSTAACHVRNEAKDRLEEDRHLTGSHIQACVCVSWLSLLSDDQAVAQKSETHFWAPWMETKTKTCVTPALKILSHTHQSKLTDRFRWFQELDEAKLRTLRRRLKQDCWEQAFPKAQPLRIHAPSSFLRASRHRDCQRV